MLKTYSHITPLFCLLILLLSAGGQVEAQDFTTDFARMQSAYAELDKYYTHMDIHLTEADGTTQFHQQAEVHKSGSDFLYRLGNRVMLYTETANIVVDHAGKTVVVGNVSPDAVSTLGRLSPELDGIEKQYEEVRTIAHNEREIHYQIKDSRREIVLTDLFLDPETYLIQRVEYTYNPIEYGEGTQCVILFERQNIAPRFARKQFDETQFVHHAGGNWECASSLADYQLHILPTH